MPYVFTCTPDAWAAQQRSTAAADKRRAAAKVAMARAARYNLTLRRAELQQARGEHEVEQGSGKRGSLRRVLSKRLSGAVGGAGKRRSGGSAKPDAARAPAPAAPAAPAPDEEEHVIMWMGELAKALESQHSRSINTAILSAFLSEMAPERLPEVEAMLDESVGREEELFDSLAQKYPVSAEHQSKLNESTIKALEAQVPHDHAEDEANKGYILSVGGDGFSKWATNVQSHILKERMLRAGATEADVNAVLNNSSEMI
jgi:hypothetical protein